MVTIVKHEWHQVDSQFAYELTTDTLAEIYPDLDEAELDKLMADIEMGYKDIEEVINDALDNDIEIEWDRQYDDWWTDRKGGYEVTYELGDDDSWHCPPQETPNTHKCTKCRWTGKSYEAGTLYFREDGSVIENYFDTDEESDDTKDVCPMCDSDIELTEEGREQEERTKKIMAELDSDDENYEN